MKKKLKKKSEWVAIPRGSHPLFAFLNFSSPSKMLRRKNGLTYHIHCDATGKPEKGAGVLINESHYSFCHDCVLAGRGSHLHDNCESR